MSTLSEREKNKLVQEKCQSILTELLKDEDNKYCVDCDAKSPRWASWNIGIFLCIRCAGIHRNLGVHISRVKSVNLDTWTPQQVACIQQMGNSRARAVYEANLPDSFRRPQMDSALEQFVRAKYEAKKYIAREWVPPAMPNPTWDLELEKQLKKKKREKISATVELPAPVKGSNRGSSVSPKPLPKAPGSKSSSPSPGTSAKNASSTSKSAASTTVTTTATQDLLGLDMKLEDDLNLEYGQIGQSIGGVLIPSTDAPTNNTSADSSDPFGEFLAAPSTQVNATSQNQGTNNCSSAAKTTEGSVATEEESFFNQKLPEGGSDKLTKDSILALYGKNQPQAQPPPTMFGANVYLGATPGQQVPPQQSTMANGGVMPQQSQQNIMFMQQGAIPGGPQAPNPFFAANGMPQNLATSLQLSAANPFAQMQSQMAGLNMGGVGNMMGGPAGPQVMPQHTGMVGPMAGMTGTMGMAGGTMPNSSVMPHAMPGVPNSGGFGGTNTTLSTNLWQ